MKMYQQYTIKRLVLRMKPADFAAFLGVTTEEILAFEKGERISNESLDKIKELENHIRAFPKDKYLKTRILEEAMQLQYEEPFEHLKTLAHLIVHASKLQMLMFS